MEPPTKRPRFSFLSDEVSSSHELDIARSRNDQRLKARFESIFEKYERDFGGIGDEIDLITGHVVVDNGHILSMRDEQDIGAIQGGTRFGGGSLLKAMTVPPEDQQIAIDSIEEDATGRSLTDAIATLGSYNSPIPIESDEDDDTVGTPMETGSDDGDSLLGSPMREKEPVGGIPPKATSGPSDTHTVHDKIVRNSPYLSTDPAEIPRSSITPQHNSTDQLSSAISVRSDYEDSMLGDVVIKTEEATESIRDNDEHGIISDSDDSLLGSSAQHAYEIGSSPDFDHWTDNLPLSSRDAPTDDAIVGQFGPEIGPKVIEVLARRKLAHENAIEPVWRVPDTGQDISFGGRPSVLTGARGDFQSLSPQRGSVWAPPKKRRGRPRKANTPSIPESDILESPRLLSRSFSVVSGDSVDPLQEDSVDKGNKRQQNMSTPRGKHVFQSELAWIHASSKETAIAMPRHSSEVVGPANSENDEIDELLDNAVGSHESLEDWSTLEPHGSLQATGNDYATTHQTHQSDSGSSTESTTTLLTTRKENNISKMKASNPNSDLARMITRKEGEKKPKKDPRNVEAQLNKYKTTPAEFKELIRLREVEGYSWEDIYPYFPNHSGKQLNYWLYRYWNSAKLPYKLSKMTWTSDDDSLLGLLKPMTSLSWDDILAFFPGRKLVHIAPRLAAIWRQDMLKDRQMEPPVVPGPVAVETDTTQVQPSRV